MSKGLIATKIGMSQHFDSSGQHMAVTLLKIEDNTVIGKKEKKLLLGTNETKAKKIAKPQRVFFEKANLPYCRKLKEFECDDVANFECGQKLGVDLFKDIKHVDVTGYTKGRGFAGVIKRHNFHSLCASHGVSISERSHGSTGGRQDPGKVWKGKKMAGHYGDEKRTILNIPVVGIIPEQKIILIRGGVPGAIGSTVYIRKAIKKVS